MFFNKHKTLIILIILGVFLGIIFLYFQEIKQKELQVELDKIELRNIRVGVGTSKGKMGTAIFGEIVNNGNRSIKIAAINVLFLSESGEKIKEKKFFPVNNFSFSDSSPLIPGYSKKFGFSIDDFVPEKWGGKISAKLVDLKFK
tara:strand:- start:111 stop:542 length:432 start_codon:yes stop_codon:yes gene_type:complete